MASRIPYMTKSKLARGVPEVFWRKGVRVARVVSGDYELIAQHYPDALKRVHGKNAGSSIQLWHWVSGWARTVLIPPELTKTAEMLLGQVVVSKEALQGYIQRKLAVSKANPTPETCINPCGWLCARMVGGRALTRSHMPPEVLALVEDRADFRINPNGVLLMYNRDCFDLLLEWMDRYDFRLDTPA